MEDELGKRVVGQPDAVRAVSDAVRRARSGWPWGNWPRWASLAATNRLAEALGQLATQAPQPMQLAVSKALVAWSRPIRIALAAGALPVFTEQ